ncbi:MAG: hypothetical protein ACH350_00250 [Parachlamydiaceae bacterium]
MFDTQLFLGFLLFDTYLVKLRSLSDSERALFIQHEDPAYLQLVVNQGVEYLGKYLGQSVDMATVDLSSSHIYSVLRKLVPDFPYKDHPLVLFALPIHSSCQLG